MNLSIKDSSIIAQDSVLSTNTIESESKDNKFEVQINRQINSSENKPSESIVAKFNNVNYWVTETHTVESFVEEVIKKGFTFRFGIKENGNSKENIKRVFGFCLDFDGDYNTEEGKIVPPLQQAVTDSFFQQHAIVIYTSPSYEFGKKEKYRVVFLFDSVQDGYESAENIISTLIECYPYADKGCKDAGRLWFGSRSNGQCYIFGKNNRIVVNDIISSKVTLAKPEKAKSVPKQARPLNPDDFDSSKQIESVEKDNPGITGQVLEYLHDKIFIDKLGGDVRKLYSLREHSFREIRVDDNGMVRKFEGANPWKPPTSDKPTSFVVCHYERNLPLWYDRSGNYSYQHRNNEKEQYGGSYLEYWYELNKPKYIGTLKDNFKQIVHDICDYFEVERFDFRSGKKSKRQIIADMIRESLGIRLSFNEMILEPELDGIPINFDYIVPKLREEFDIETSKVVAQEEILYLAHQNSYHPVRDYLLEVAERFPIESVEGMLEGLSTKYFKTDKEIYDVYVKKTLIAGVARVFEPGSMHKSSLVLQGVQNARKSSWIRELIGKKWFNDNVNIGDVTNKDDRQIVNAFWGHEIDEIDRLFRKADRSNLKSFLSQPSDNFRKPYSSKPESHPRTSIFFGTTNDRGILHDPTGSVRFWVIPIATNCIDTDLVKEERDKLWACAFHAYNAGFKWDLTSEEDKLRAESNKQFDVSDEWETIVLGFAEQFQKVAVSMILAGALGIPAEKHDRKHQIRVEDILRKNDWKKPEKDQKKIFKKKFVVWQNPNTDYEGKPLKLIEEAYAQCHMLLFPYTTPYEQIQVINSSNPEKF